MPTTKELKDRFTEIYRENIKREGAEKMLDYLNRSDFFNAPASTRFHGSYEGGLCEHSINVYLCLKDIMERPRMKNVYGITASDESIALVSLLHDVCKINCYVPGWRNVKDERGVWQSVRNYEFKDQLPYGHGEKSVYIVSGYMKLSRDEAFAIRYHMGFSGPEDNRVIGDALEMFPLAFALMVADMEASYFLEGRPE